MSSGVGVTSIENLSVENTRKQTIIEIQVFGANVGYKLIFHQDFRCILVKFQMYNAPNKLSENNCHAEYEIKT